MKKIKYILSLGLLLGLFGFSSAQNIDLSQTTTPNVFSFETPISSNNITYLINNHYGGNFTLTFLNNLGYEVQPVKFYYSDYTGVGQYITEDGFSDLLNHSLDKYSINGFPAGRYMLFMRNNNVGSYGPNFIKYYYQRNSESDGSGNFLVSFTDNLSSFSNIVPITTSYLRFFYGETASNSGENLFWNNNNYTPGVADLDLITPRDYQLFTPNTNSFRFSRGIAYLPQVDSMFMVTPSLSYGFSYVDLTATTWEDLRLYTVFPFYNQYEGYSQGSFTMPDWAYTDKFYMFRIGAASMNSDNTRFGVLAKCDLNTCGIENIFNSLLYSEYTCNYNNLRLDTNTKYINLKESCSFIRGGIFKNVLDYNSNNNGTSSIPYKFNTVDCGSMHCNNTYLYSNGVASPYSSWYVNGNNFSFGAIYNNYAYVGNGYFPFYQNHYITYGFGTLDTSIQVDLLANYNNIYDTPGNGTILSGQIISNHNANQVLNQLCAQNSLYAKTIFCQSGGTTVILSGTDIPYVVTPQIVSGKVYFQISAPGEPNYSGYLVEPNGNVMVPCEDRSSYCPTQTNIVNYLGGGEVDYSQGFRLKENYYKNFLSSTSGYLFKCPYPYSDDSFSSTSYVGLKLMDYLGGFDIFLPVNCFMASVKYGNSFDIFDFDTFDISGHNLMYYVNGSNNYSQGLTILCILFDIILSVGIFYMYHSILHLFDSN